MMFCSNSKLKAAERTDMVDISSYQQSLTISDYKKMMAQGVKAVVIKATEGTSYQNPYLKEQAKNAYSAGLSVNFYHFAHFLNTSEARNEAQYFATTVKKITNNKNGVMVNDVESPEIATNALGYNVKLNKVFVEELKKSGFYKTDTYTMASWFNQVIERVGKQKGWVASYDISTNKPLYMSANAWQWSSNKVFTGIDGKVFDVSQLNNDLYAQSKVKRENHIGKNLIAYSVEVGDTLTSISNKYNVNYYEVARMNNIKNPNLILPKQILIIKQVKEYRYTIKKGDTLSKISLKLNVNIQHLIDVNNISNINLIFPNTVIKW